MTNILTFLLFILVIPIFAQSADRIVYKQVDTTTLYIDIYQPDPQPDKSYPAMIFFYGGGWNGGSVEQFVPHANYFSSRGIVCFLVDYRVKNRQQSTPFESLMDAKSAIRFVRKNAAQYQVDTARIIAAGGSAGGHLAAATALISRYNEATDDLSISCVPNALVLFNPVIDNGPGGYGFDRIVEAYKDFSPLHNIRLGAPPTIFFLGTKDKLIPVETAKYFQKVMEKVGSLCELHLYEGAGHGFFNHNNLNYYNKTVFATDLFLKNLGYVHGDPKIDP